MSRLKHLLRLNYGDALAQDLRRHGAIPVFGSNGMVGFHNEANTFGPCVIVGRKGSFGKVTWSDLPVLCIDTAYFVDSRSCPGSLRFAFYALQSLHLDECSRDTGVPGLSREDAHNRAFPFPAANEQDQIAAWLDRETVRIEELVQEKRQFINLLREKMAAIAATAVTRGVRGDSRNAPVRESGVGWIGRVPSHWETVRIATIFREVDRPADPRLPVLSVSIHSGVTDKELGDEDRDRKANLSEDRTKYQRVRPGDLVYNMMRAWQGAFGTVTVDGLISPAYVVAEPKKEFRTKFIELLLQTASGSEEVRRFSKGIADFRMRLYWEHFRSIKICLPPLAEQDEIIRHVESETARISTLVEETKRSVDLLNEHRFALICAAVTGKIDVRGTINNKSLKAAA